MPVPATPSYPYSCLPRFSLFFLPLPTTSLCLALFTCLICSSHFFLSLTLSTSPSNCLDLLHLTPLPAYPATLPNLTSFLNSPTPITNPSYHALSLCCLPSHPCVDFIPYSLPGHITLSLFLPAPPFPWSDLPQFHKFLSTPLHTILSLINPIPVTAWRDSALCLPPTSYLSLSVSVVCHADSDIGLLTFVRHNFTLSYSYFLVSTYQRVMQRAPCHAQCFQLQIPLFLCI